MTSLSPEPIKSAPIAAPAEQLAQLRAIQALVDELAGTARGYAPGESGDLDARYDIACPIAQSRFDALASETAAFAAAGLSALIAGQSAGAAGSAGAALLAREMDRAIRKMEALLR